MNSWRAAVAVAVLVVVTGACGSDAGGKGTRTAGGKDAAGRPKLPVGGTAAGADRSSTELASPVAGDAIASTLAPVRFLEYRLADGAKAPATEAAAYKVVAKDTKDSAADVARALDVDKDQVDVQQGLGWYYSAKGTGSVSSGVAVACSSDGECPEPVRPPPPPGVPTAGEAETRFRKMLTVLGIDTSSGVFEVQPDQGDYFRQVTFHQKVKGIEVEGFESSIAFGENGRIEYANGFLGTFDKVGTYPLVDLAAALKRQNQGFGGGIRPLGAAEQGSSDPAVTNVAPASSPANGSTGSGSSPGGAGGGVPPSAPDESTPAPDEPTVTIEPQPSPPTEPLEPEVVEVTGADLVLQVVFGRCPGDTVFLVPAFRFLPRERAGFSIPAVDDASLSLANPADDEVKGAEPCPGQTDPGVPVGKPTDPGQTDPGVPVGKPEPAPASLPPDAGRGAPAPKP